MNHHASLSLSTARYSAKRLGGGASGASLAMKQKATSTITSGISARPNTLCQPKAIASPGANSAANAVPELPAPAMPMAVPWCSGGYQREASGSAAANDAPATPRKIPSTSTSPKECTPASQA